MKMITILSLDGCDKCKKYIAILKESMLRFNTISCNSDSNSDFCDNVESIVDCNMYPMTIVNDRYILSFTNDYKKINTVCKKNNYDIIYVHSIDNMFDTLTKLVHL